MAEHNQQFETFAHWVNKASSWLTRHQNYGPNFRAICFDTQGRLCTIGRDMMRARDENAFPVSWVWPDQVAAMAKEAAQAKTESDAWRPVEEHDGSTREVLGMNEYGDIHRTWFFAPSSDTRNWLIVGRFGGNRSWKPIKFMPLPAGTIRPY